MPHGWHLPWPHPQRTHGSALVLVLVLVLVQMATMMTLTMRCKLTCIWMCRVKAVAWVTALQSSEGSGMGDSAAVE
jgi:hypothetical protein